MKLAEALSLRADLQKRIGELKVRLKVSGKVTEGDEPAEDVKVFIKAKERIVLRPSVLV